MSKTLTKIASENGHVVAHLEYLGVGNTRFKSLRPSLATRDSVMRTQPPTLSPPHPTFHPHLHALMQSKEIHRVGAQ